MSNLDYTRAAHRRTIWATLQRFLMDRFVDSDTPAKETLICEEVFFAEKDVGQEAFIEVIEELQRREADERVQMHEYEFRRRHGDQNAAEAPAEATSATARPGDRLRRRP